MGGSTRLLRAGSSIGRLKSYHICVSALDEIGGAW
jgi:hypothetical protein